MSLHRSAEWMRQRHRRVLRGLRVVFGLQILFSVGGALLIDIVRGTRPSLLSIGTGCLVGVLLLPKGRRVLRWLYLPLLLGIDMVHITALLWATPLSALERGSLWALAYIPVLIAAGRWWSYTGGAITLTVMLASDALVLFTRLPWRNALPIIIFQGVTAALGVWVAALTESRTRRDLLLAEAHRVTARHLHDLSAQVGSSVSALQAIDRQLLELDISRPTASMQAEELITQITLQNRSTLQLLLRSLRSVEPATLQSRTLPEIIASELRILNDEHGISSLFRCDGHLPALSPAIADFVLRAAQALIHNVLIHASATRLEVDLHGQDDEVVLQVQDDGPGFSSTLPASGTLAELKIYAEQLGGTINITGNQGTTVTVVAPTSAPFAVAHSTDQLVPV